jgi:hypothetical protein
MPKRVQLTTDPHGLTGMNDFTAADRGAKGKLARAAGSWVGFRRYFADSTCIGWFCRLKFI